MRRRTGSQVVGMDIGSSKVCVVIAELQEDGLEVVGLGTRENKGVQKGQIVSMEAAAEAIGGAIEEAEKMARLNVRSAIIGLGNTTLRGVTSQGMLPLRERTVTAEDVAEVVAAAESVTFPEDSEILHVLPQEYILDGTRGITDPIGMRGMRLTANCYIVITESASVENLVESCHHAGIGIDEVILEPLAAAEAVLTAEERELGTALIDLGGGTTDVIVLSGGAVRYATSLPFGGWHVTNDISQVLNLAWERAEWLKKRHGHLCIAEVMPGEEVELDSGDDAEPHYLDQRELCEIVEARILEILQITYDDLMRNDLDPLFSRVVITGGSAAMRGMTELGQSIFTDKRVRVGKPQHIGGLIDVVSSPSYSTAVGLVMLGSLDLGLSKFSRMSPSVISRAGKNIKTWVKKLIK
jgi:cell division protein FtsA